jgi:hypothetical protein
LFTQEYIFLELTSLKSVTYKLLFSISYLTSVGSICEPVSCRGSVKADAAKRAKRSWRDGNVQSFASADSETNHQRWSDGLLRSVAAGGGLMADRHLAVLRAVEKPVIVTALDMLLEGAGIRRVTKYLAQCAFPPAPYFEIRSYVVILQQHVQQVRAETMEDDQPASWLDGEFVYGSMGLDVDEEDVVRDMEVDTLARKLIAEVHEYTRGRLREVAAAGLAVSGADFGNLVRLNRDLIKDLVHFKVFDRNLSAEFDATDADVDEIIKKIFGELDGDGATTSAGADTDPVSSSGDDDGGGADAATDGGGGTERCEGQKEIDT